MRAILGAMAALLVPMTGLTAQTLSVDLRGIGAVTTEDFIDADLGPGFGFGAVLAFRVQPHVHLYGGWDWVHLTAETSFAGTDRDFEETGYTFGVRFEHPMGSGDLAYRLEGGGVYKHIEVENADGDVLIDTDHDLGFEAGAGLRIPVGDGWGVVPLLRFRTMTPELTLGSTTRDGTLRYVGLELGVTRRF